MQFFVRLRDWKVGTRLAFGFGLILSLLCVVAVLGMLGIDRSRSMHNVFEEALAVRQQGSHVNTLLQQDLIKTQAIIRSAGMPEVVERFKPELQAADQTIAQVLEKLAGNRVVAVKTQANTLRTQHQQYVKTRNEVLELVETGQTLLATEQENQVLLPAAAAVTRESDKLLQQVEQHTQEAQANFAHTTATAQWLIGALTLVTLLAGTAWAWFIARSVSRPALAAMQVSEAIAEGRLSHSVHVEAGQDELGRMLDSMRRMRANLLQLTGEVRDQSEQLAVTSHQVATDATHLSRSSQEHASELAQRSANAAREIKQLIVDSANRVTEGAELVEQTGNTIHNLQNTIDEVAQLITHLTHTSQEHAQGIGNVRETVHRLDEATQHNMVLMAQSTQAAEGLKSQADRLLASVSFFQLSPSGT